MLLIECEKPIAPLPYPWLGANLKDNNEPLFGLARMNW